MAKSFIFVDEAGDPGQPFVLEKDGTKTPTGASTFYIITALSVDEKKLFTLEHRMMEIKTSFGYKKEIKSNEISLPLYEALLRLIDQLDVKTYYRLVDKNVYKGKFKIEDVPSLHNVFDEYNVARTVAYALAEGNLTDVDIVIDRTDRRKLAGKFDSFNTYLAEKVKKYMNDVAGSPERISHITHVDSKYVNVMQMSDIISGAIRDNFTKKNETLIKLIDKTRLILCDRKYEKKLRVIKSKVLKALNITP